MLRGVLLDCRTLTHEDLFLVHWRRKSRDKDSMGRLFSCPPRTHTGVPRLFPLQISHPRSTTNGTSRVARKASPCTPGSFPPSPWLEAESGMVARGGRPRGTGATRKRVLNGQFTPWGFDSGGIMAQFQALSPLKSACFLAKKV